MKVDITNFLKAVPAAHLLLDRDLKIIEVSDGYLQVTLTARNEIIGRHLFDVFPDNPNDPHARGVESQRSSFQTVLLTAQPHSSGVLKYDIPNPAAAGQFEERWWHPVNAPIFDIDGRVEYILHTVVDVTASVKLEKMREQQALDATASAKQALLGGGEMGVLMRQHDFGKTPLGPVEAWPQSLKTAVGMMLDNKFGMYIAWGQEFTQLYNDGYRPILGSTKHPHALGCSASVTFAESWHIIEPLFQQVMGGESVGSEDWLLPLNRHGFLEDCYFTFSYSPIRVESGAVGGVLVTVSETTEHMKAKKAAEQNHSETTRIFESIPQIVWTSLPDGSADFYNQHWYDYTGWNFEQTKHWGWKPLVHPDDFERAISSLQKSIQTGTVWEHEHRLLRAKDNMWRWHLVRSVPLKGPDGSVVKWVGTATDVHDQRLAQAEIEDILESMNEGFFSVDPEFRVTRVNSRHIELTKIPKDQQIGRSLFDLFPEAKNQQSKYWVEYHRAMNERVICKFEDYYAPLELWTAVTVYPNPAGGFAAFFRDVTQDKVAIRQIESQATELKTIQDRFERSAKETDLGVWYCDLPFDVLNWNAEVKNHFFLPPDAEVTIDTFYDRMHPEDREKTKRAIDLSIQMKTGYDTIYRTMSADPSGNSSHQIKWIRAVGWTDYDASGAPIRFDGITLDVTEALSREAELRQSKEAAESANATKSAFLANMSHEIRTPLGAILGFSELLRDPNLAVSERDHFINTIHRSGQALTRIIDDILDLAKVEAGKLEVESVDFSLPELLAEVMDLFGEKTRQKDIFLYLNVHEDVPERISSDSTRLRQILINIIGNAVKFTESGGVRVSVHAKPLTERKVEIGIAVKDTGPGLTAEEIARIFNPFTQADNTTTRKFGGTGLGLALSRRLAEALGGTIHVTDSKHFEGSTFLISFIANTAAEESRSSGTLAGTRAPIGKVLSGYTIMLVDDSPENQFLVKRLLQKYGAEVDVAGDGGQAVELALKKQFHVVLMDIQMPVLDGYQALSAIRARGSRIPILALTAHAMGEEREKTRLSGFAGHLTKPINAQEMVSMILRIAGSSE